MDALVTPWATLGDSESAVIDRVHTEYIVFNLISPTVVSSDTQPLGSVGWVEAGAFSVSNWLPMMTLATNRHALQPTTECLPSFAPKHGTPTHGSRTSSTNRNRTDVNKKNKQTNQRQPKGTVCVLDVIAADAVTSSSADVIEASPFSHTPELLDSQLANDFSWERATERERERESGTTDTTPSLSLRSNEFVLRLFYFFFLVVVGVGVESNQDLWGFNFFFFYFRLRFRVWMESVGQKGTRPTAAVAIEPRPLFFHFSFSFSFCPKSPSFFCLFKSATAKGRRLRSSSADFAIHWISLGFAIPRISANRQRRLVTLDRSMKLQRNCWIIIIFIVTAFELVSVIFGCFVCLFLVDFIGFGRNSFFFCRARLDFLAISWIWLGLQRSYCVAIC